MKRRTTRDLVDALCTEASRTGPAALVVAMASRTALVQSADPEPLLELHRLLRSGGRPVGILMYPAADGAEIRAEPLRECAGEAWVDGYLRAVARAEADRVTAAASVGD
jgi:hypothetical protein